MTLVTSIGQKVPTGISGLDELLDGGIPQGRLVLLSAGPGSGKTILSVQFLWSGATKYGEPGVLVTMDEDESSLKADMATLGFDLEALEKEGKFAIIDLSGLSLIREEDFKKDMFGARVVQTPEFSIESMLLPIKTKVKEMNAKRVVVDGLSSITIREPNAARRRQHIAYIFKALRETGCTTLVTSEGTGTSVGDKLDTEHYLAQGVIQMSSVVKDRVLKSIRITKMRGVKHDEQPHPYFIEHGGVTIFPSEVAI